MFVPAAGFLIGVIVMLILTAAMQLFRLCEMCWKKEQKPKPIPHIPILVRYAASLLCMAIAIGVTLQDVRGWMGQFQGMKAMCEQVVLDFETYEEYGLSEDELGLYQTAVIMNQRLKAMQTTGWIECIWENEMVRSLEPIDLSNFIYTPSAEAEPAAEGNI